MSYEKEILKCEHYNSEPFRCCSNADAKSCTGRILHIDTYENDWIFNTFYANAKSLEKKKSAHKEVIKLFSTNYNEISYDGSLVWS